MKTNRSLIITVLLTLTSLVLAATIARADSYSWQNLQSDIPGVAQHTDPNLVNPWGMAANSNGTVIWVSDNGTGVSTLYHQDGTALSLIVTIPAEHHHDTGNPTGVVFNGTSFFQVTKNGNSQPARFIFASEDGVISGWNSMVDPTNAIIAVDHHHHMGPDHAVYKG